MSSISDQFLRPTEIFSPGWPSKMTVFIQRGVRSVLSSHLLILKADLCHWGSGNYEEWKRKTWFESLLLGPSQLNCGSDRQRTPLQDGDHTGNELQLVPCFPLLRSEMFPEWFRRVSVSVSSRENSFNLDIAPKRWYSVLLKPWDNFSVTLPLISSESCVI